jgi:replication-associated recombination protein RarA
MSDDHARQSPHLKPTTTRGYPLDAVVSALQKAIRRGDGRLAGYFAIELFESGFEAYAWRRLMTVSAEDCHGCITQELKALYDCAAVVKKARRTSARIFLAKATVLLAEAMKCRDADHLTNLVYDRRAVDETALLAALEEARSHTEPIPDYAYDVHTREGKRRGKTKTDFFLSEHDALSPRAPGLFDADVERLRGGDGDGSTK